jgi:hypothetical protein
MGKTIALFDVDGTLTVPRKTADPETLAFLQELRKARRRWPAACLSSTSLVLLERLQHGAVLERHCSEALGSASSQRSPDLHCRHRGRL